MQGLDNNARVIYIGTVSKVLFPALRLGYLVIPPDLVERFMALRQSMDLCPSYQTQSAVMEFMRGGHLSRHVRRRRALYADRRRVLVEEIRREFGDACTIGGSEAGMHFTLLMPGPIKDHEMAATALRHKVLVSPLSVAHLGRNPQHGLVLGFGSTRADQIAGGVRVLKKYLGLNR